MEIFLQKQQISSALAIVANAIGNKKDGKVLIEYKNKCVYFTAFDMLEVSCKIPLVEGEEGKAVLSTQDLLSVIKTAENREIVNISDKSRSMVEITFANDQSDKLPNLIEEFDIEKSLIKKPRTFTIPATTFQEMLFNTGFSIPVNDSRHYLNAGCLIIKDSVVSLSSSDGRRVSISESRIDSKIRPRAKLFIPRATIIALTKLVKPNSHILKVQFNKSAIRFEMNDVVITSGLITEPEEYPDLESIFAKQENMTHIHMRKEPLMQFLLRMNRDRCIPSQAYFGFSKSESSVECYNRSKTITTRIPLVAIKEDMLISFNPSYLLDVIKRITTTSFVLAIRTAPKSSAIITYKSLSENQFCIMPMRITSEK